MLIIITVLSQLNLDARVLPNLILSTGDRPIRDLLADGHLRHQQPRLLLAKQPAPAGYPSPYLRLHDVLAELQAIRLERAVQPPPGGCRLLPMERPVLRLLDELPQELLQFDDQHHHAQPVVVAAGNTMCAGHAG